MKSELKPPGTKLLKLKYDVLLSTSAFKYKLRHNIKDAAGSPAAGGCGGGGGSGAVGVDGKRAGAYTRSLFSST